MRIGIVIPTIPGREQSLQRTIRSYRAHSRGVSIVFSIHENARASGEGWRKGATTLAQGFGPTDYLHLTNDDIEVTDPDWWRTCIETCDEGQLPAPVVYNPDGSLQSAGGQIGAPGDLIQEIGRDRSPVGFTTVPFLSWGQWEQIGMLDVHYSSDVWVSERGRQLGYETILRHAYQLTHHNHQVGRAGQMQRSVADKEIVMQALREATA